MAKTITLRATLQADHLVATSRKDKSNIMQVSTSAIRVNADGTFESTRKFAWAVQVETSWPARASFKDYTVNGAGQKFWHDVPAREAGSSKWTRGGFAGSKELAESAVRKEVSVGKYDAKGTTKRIVWSEVLPLEVVS